MEFLVRTTNHLPADTPAERVQELKRGERARAQELREAGVLKRIWRVPATRSSVQLLEARDATEVHDALASLPMFPWMEITVEALAVHPQEAASG
jgi:muconolactone D-isomerase